MESISFYTFVGCFFYSHHNLSQWSKPNVGYIKCNVCVAVFNENSNSNFGMCIHGNNVGLFLTKTICTKGSPIAIEVEAITLLHACNHIDQRFKAGKCDH